MSDKVPTSVRYVKNGRSGQWWRAAKANGQVHLGWNTVPNELLVSPDFPEIERILRKVNGPRQGVKQDFNALRDLLDCPSQHVWMTFEDGCMWWCTVLDGATVNPGGESVEKGNFWLVCKRPWPAGLPIALWTGDRVAELVVRLGLGEWVESRLA
jgi:hypothetical protein